jgi:hypothetical protein
MLTAAKNQRGAVLTEFIIVVGFVLVPLFIGLTLIGKYTESAQKLEQAARYSAWERTVWFQEIPASLAKADKSIATKKTAEQIAFELDNRIFSSRDVGVYLAQQTKAVNEDNAPMTESFWLEKGSKSSSLYKLDNNKRMIQVVDVKQAKMSGTSGTVKKVVKTMGEFTGFDIDFKGPITTTVKLSLIQPEYFKKYITSDIAVNRSQTLLAEGWNAAGVKQARSRVQGLVPSALLSGTTLGSALNKVRDFFAKLPLAKEIKSNSLIFGHVVIDSVPEYRLKKYKK